VAKKPDKQTDPKRIAQCLKDAKAVAKELDIGKKNFDKIAKLIKELGKKSR
jgi:hypothetical protein